MTGTISQVARFYDTAARHWALTLGLRTVKKVSVFSGTPGGGVFAIGVRKWIESRRKG